MNLKVFIKCKTLSYFTGKPFTSSNKTVFGYNNSNFPMFSAICAHLLSNSLITSICYSINILLLPGYLLKLSQLLRNT